MPDAKKYIFITFFLPICMIVIAWNVILVTIQYICYKVLFTNAVKNCIETGYISKYKTLKSMFIKSISNLKYKTMQYTYASLNVATVLQLGLSC